MTCAVLLPPSHLIIIMIIVMTLFSFSPIFLLFRSWCWQMVTQRGSFIRGCLFLPAWFLRMAKPLRTCVRTSSVPSQSHARRNWGDCCWSESCRHSTQTSLWDLSIVGALDISDYYASSKLQSSKNSRKWNALKDIIQWEGKPLVVALVVMFCLILDLLYKTVVLGDGNTMTS